MISFLLEHVDKNWTANGRSYVFDTVEQQGIGILASKCPDGTKKANRQPPKSANTATIGTLMAEAPPARPAAA